MKLNRTVAAIGSGYLPVAYAKAIGLDDSAAGGIRITVGQGTWDALSRNAPDVEHKGYSILASLADFGRG